MTRQTLAAIGRGIIGFAAALACVWLIVWWAR